jgi:paraquat-inducible protein A
MLLACPDCGAIQCVAPSPPRAEVLCRVCDMVLEDPRGRSLDAAIACSLATFLLLLPANFLPIMTINVAGISESTHLASGLGTSWQQGWPVVTAVLALQGFILPFAYFTLLTGTLAAIRFGLRGQLLGRLFRYCLWLDRWAMLDVMAIGFGVGYGRIEARIHVHVDIGGWCFLATAFLTLFTRAAVEKRTVWRRLAMPQPTLGSDVVACTTCDLVLPGHLTGTACPRCAAILHRRRTGSARRCAALIVASWTLMLPSYILPMSAFWEAGTPHPHSIPAGIAQLFSSGFWPLGILIAVTSVGVPVGKLLGLSWCLLAIRTRSPRRLKFRTKLFRLVDDIGRWSNLDPFTVMIFAPMIPFGQLAHIDIRGGSLAFLAMVAVSMIAAHVLDPRLMWDAAERPDQGAAASPLAHGRVLSALAPASITNSAERDDHMALRMLSAVRERKRTCHQR